MEGSRLPPLLTDGGHQEVRGQVCSDGEDDDGEDDDGDDEDDDGDDGDNDDDNLAATPTTL